MMVEPDLEMAAARAGNSTVPNVLMDEQVYRFLLIDVECHQMSLDSLQIELEWISYHRNQPLLIPMISLIDLLQNDDDSFSNQFLYCY